MEKSVLIQTFVQLNPSSVLLIFVFNISIGAQTITINHKSKARLARPERHLHAGEMIISISSKPKKWTTDGG